MNGFTLITLRWYHGGVLDLSSGEPIYNGGKVTEFLDVDVDKMPYFELKDYIRELGYSTTCTFSIKAPNSDILVDVDNDKDILDMMCSLEDGDEVEVFVRHLVDKAIVGPMLIENGSHVNMGKSGSAFNTRPSESENFNFRVGENHLNSENLVVTFSTSPHFTTIPPFNTATTDGATDDDIDAGPVGPDFSEEEVEGSDYSTEDSVESKVKLVGDDNEKEYGSDVHEEVRELRAEKRSFLRRKRRERVAADNEEVPIGEAGPDLGFDETETGKVSHEGRLRGDEPYFASSDEDSFELDEDGCCNDDEHESGRSRRVLEENISRFMDCTIEFNKAAGFEVKEVSTNPTIEPPEITNMPGRPPKARRKKTGETKKSGKLPRTELAMTCSICHVRGHNKRGYPQREGVESSTRQSAPSHTASVRAEPTSSGRERGKPKSGMPSSKIYSTGKAKVTRSSDVTGDIDYTPNNTTKLK
ncbi:hypothetical protein H5410_033016 [Solanum commersonii]|uniref:PB1-like domain-containing protein n=1 Tax=Solanum commersonii TaxID=4109 RepID=A0A9J5YRV5_SOLCO|nr:hypothetical protein H5410_033016 [Solanum commersonii]